MTKRFGERLVEAGVVSAEAVAQARAHQLITGYRIGDCLLELRLVPETTLLRFLASEFKTRFVSAEKLGKLNIPPPALDKVPVRMAEKEDFLPIAWEPERKILSIVAAEVQNQALFKEIALVSDASDVVAYVGSRLTIQAAIRKHYYGDPTAFAALEGGAPAPARQSRPSGLVEPGEAREGTNPGGGTAARAQGTQVREARGPSRGMVGEGDYLETLTLLVGLLEQPREAFRGHSTQVSRQAATIARRMGLPPREVTHTAMAGVLHELGKRADRHLTLPLLAHQPDLQAEARRQVRAPTRLFEAVHLPAGVNAILAQLYEAWDGSGLPQGAREAEITAGARIIAAVDAYFELTRNPANPWGRLMTKPEAIATLRAQAGTLFDPVVVEALDVLQSGDLLRQRLEQDGRQIFVADADEGVRTDLMDALARHGLVAQAVPRLDPLMDAVLAGEADTIVVGLGYGAADLAAFLQFLRGRPESGPVPLLVLGEPTDPPSRDRLVQAGATGFLPMPLVPEAAASAILTVYQDRVAHGGPGHPVRGSFEELAPAELARVLGDHRKSGRLSVHAADFDGQVVLEQGRAVYAVLGDQRGAAALTALFALPHADFQFDPEGLLAELPNVDQDLGVLARELSGSPSAT